MASVFAYSQEISHEWQRRSTVRNFRAGRVGVDAICDADFLLRAAAQYHGTPARYPCPVCGSDLTVVSWVYGDNLGRRSATARSEEEIDALVAEVGPITVHFVEVCIHCGWNHLLREVTAAPVV